MGLPQAEYHFMTAVSYGSVSIDASDALLPPGAFHKAMAEGMLELTRSLMQISDRLDDLAGGAGPSRPGHGSVVGSSSGVLVAEPGVAPDPASGGAPPERLRPTPEDRRERND